MEEKENKKETTNFVKYTGLGFQMLATIGVFAFGGYQLDEYLKHEKPVGMAISGLVGVLISLYQVVRQLRE